MYHGLQSQAMIPLKHCWIKIDDYIYQHCHDGKTGVSDEAQVERYSQAAYECQCVRGLRYSRVALKLSQSNPRAAKKVFLAISGVPKRKPHDFAK
jgi:hypothetical protein